MHSLEAGRIYNFNGGFFQAEYIEEEERFELHTYRGYSGGVIGRTGIDIDAGGQLYHRVFDFEAWEQIRIPAEGATIEDLLLVDEREIGDKK